MSCCQPNVYSYSLTAKILINHCPLPCLWMPPPHSLFISRGNGHQDCVGWGHHPGSERIKVQEQLIRIKNIQSQRVLFKFKSNFKKRLKKANMQLSLDNALLCSLLQCSVLSSVHLNWNFKQINPPKPCCTSFMSTNVKLR